MLYGSSPTTVVCPSPTICAGTGVVTTAGVFRPTKGATGGLGRGGGKLKHTG